MAETRNKRIQPALAAEARENARCYWARKTASLPAVNGTNNPSEASASAPATDEPLPED